MRSKRYSKVAIVLHWLIAASLIGLILVGWWMGEAINEPETRDAAYAAFQLHKAFGVTVLVLSLARLVWRLMNPPPPMSTAQPTWERFAAKATHAAFYALSIGIPIAGLVYVSAAWNVEADKPFAVATSYFGLFTIPHLPFIEHLAPEARRAIAHMSINAHGKMAWGVIILLGLHAGAALKHHVVDRDDVLAGMVPFLKLRGETGEPARDGAAPFAAGVAVVLALALGTALAGSPEKLFPKAVEAPAPQIAPAPLPDATPAEPGQAPSADVQRWTVDPRASEIEFSGVHAGKDFAGKFERWTADIRFDPENLDRSQVIVEVDVGSARTGDATKDGSLKEPEWFNPGQFPKARFTATRFKALGGQSYEAQGKLTIKDKTIPVTLPFALDLKDDEAKMRARITLDRIALGLGIASDPSAEWVSQSIAVDIRVEAARAK
jgi:cytochrome b561